MMTPEFLKNIIDHMTAYAIEDARDSARKIREYGNEYDAGRIYDHIMKYWEEHCLNALWDEYNRRIEEEEEST